MLKPTEENEEDEEEMVISEIRSTDSESNPNPKNESEKHINDQIMETEDKVTKRFKEADAKVKFSTYCIFFLSNKINYCLLPLSLLFYIISELNLTVYFRFLADFPNVSDGTSSIFSGNFTTYWSVLAGVLVLFFFVLLIKFYSLNMAVVYANKSVHEDMIESIIRCPSKFFDKNPSGILINKFSTDLGVIDNNIIMGLWEAV